MELAEAKFEFMDSNVSGRTLTEQVRKISQVWTNHPELELNGGSLAAYRRLAEQFQSSVQRLAELQTQVQVQLIEKDRLMEQLHQMTLRARAALRGHFGPDSIEYGLAGGTRRSERKKRRRKGAGAPESKSTRQSGISARKDQDVPASATQPEARQLFLRN